MAMSNNERIDEVPDASSRDDSRATAWPSKTPWTQLRVWAYQDGTLRELPALHALSGLSAWKSGRPPLGASFVAGTKLVHEVARVDWTGFPEQEGLAAEAQAPLPQAPARQPRPPQRDARTLQVDALREVNRAPYGVPRTSVHFRTAQALLDRRLIEIAVVENQPVLRSTMSGRALLLRVESQRTPGRRGVPR